MARLREGVQLVRPERFELPAFWFVARRSIQLSYGRDRASIPAEQVIDCSRPYPHLWAECSKRRLDTQLRPRAFA